MSPQRTPRISRPLVAALILLVLCLIVSGAVMLQRRPQPQGNAINAWGGGLPIGTTTSPHMADSADATSAPLLVDISAPSVTHADGAADTGESNFNAFFQQLFAPHAATPAPSASLQDQIQQIVSGAVTLPNNFGSIGAASRTPEQQALFAYGNAAGQAIKDFETAHPDEQAVLEAQAKDRGSPEKAAALRALAKDLGLIGARLLALSNVPPTAIDENAALGRSYVELGAKLSAVADAGGDDTQSLAAIRAYDAAADSFVDTYVALVDMFALSGVKFSNSDAGSEFSFAITGGSAQ